MGARVGRQRKLTDAQLRKALAAELTPAQIATKHSMTAQVVRRRIKQLDTTTTAAAVAPEESRRFVSVTFNAIEELTRGLERVNLLQDACDRWLRDAKDAKRYDIGPRADEVEVTWLDFSSDFPAKRKDRLQDLINQRVGKMVERSELKVADPRELILRTVAEARATVSQGVELLRMLRDSQAMEAFREELLRAVGEADPETRARIEERLRSRLVVFAAASGLGLLPGEPEAA